MEKELGKQPTPSPPSVNLFSIPEAQAQSHPVESDFAESEEEDEEEDEDEEEEEAEVKQAPKRYQAAAPVQTKAPRPPSRAKKAHGKYKYSIDDLANKNEFKVMDNGAIAGITLMKDDDGNPTGRKQWLIVQGAKKKTIVPTVSAPASASVLAKAPVLGKTPKPKVPKKKKLAKATPRLFETEVQDDDLKAMQAVHGV